MFHTGPGFTPAPRLRVTLRGVWTHGRRQSGNKAQRCLCPSCPYSCGPHGVGSARALMRLACGWWEMEYPDSVGRDGQRDGQSDGLAAAPAKITVPSRMPPLTPLLLQALQSSQMFSPLPLCFAVPSSAPGLVWPRRAPAKAGGNFRPRRVTVLGRKRSLLGLGSTTGKPAIPVPSGRVSFTRPAGHR